MGKFTHFVSKSQECEWDVGFSPPVSVATVISSKEELENFLAGTSQIGGRGAQCADNKFTLDWMEGQEFNLLNTESCSPEKLSGIETMKAHYLFTMFWRW